MRANFILKYRKLKLKFSECGPGEAEWARIAGILPPIAQTNTGKRWQTLAKTGKEVCVRNQSSKNNQHVLVCMEVQKGYKYYCIKFKLIYFGLL